MKKSLFCTLFVFLTALAFADEVKPLYRLPEKNPVNAQEGEAEHEVFLVGSDNGLFRVTNRNSAIPVWTEGRVDQLLRVTLPDASGVTRPAWLMRTQKGIFYSTTEHTSRRTYAVKSLYGLYYINLVSVEILDKDRTPALRELRANRERLGLSKDRFAEICGTKTYKEHEAGRRPIHIMDYLWYRKCLACYERGKDPGKRRDALSGFIFAFGMHGRTISLPSHGRRCS